MTRDEQKSITGFIERAIKLDLEAPLDVEADAIIRALFKRNPEAAYRITMLAMAQDAELTDIKAELAAQRNSFRGNWLMRLLNGPDATRGLRRNPRLSVYSQNIRGRPIDR